MDWERPLFNNLPKWGYRDNPDVDALTVPLDEFLVGVKVKLETLYQLLQWDTCPDEWLDWLAYLHGFSANFWLPTWAPSIKRQLIRYSNPIWRNRGTEMITILILTIMGLPVDLWYEGNLTLPITLPAAFGTNKGRVYIRLPLMILRSSVDWRNAELTRKNYLPAVMDSKVVYDRFYAGYSVVGDPVFIS